jgi:hypothetical protein
MLFFVSFFVFFVSSGLLLPRVSPSAATPWILRLLFPDFQTRPLHVQPSSRARERRRARPGGGGGRAERRARVPPPPPLSPPPSCPRLLVPHAPPLAPPRPLRFIFPPPPSPVRSAQERSACKSFFPLRWAGARRHASRREGRAGGGARARARCRRVTSCDRARAYWRSSPPNPSRSPFSRLRTTSQHASLTRPRPARELLYRLLRTTERNERNPRHRERPSSSSLKPPQPAGSSAVSIRESR